MKAVNNLTSRGMRFWDYGNSLYALLALPQSTYIPETNPHSRAAPPACWRPAGRVRTSWRTMGWRSGTPPTCRTSWATSSLSASARSAVRCPLAPLG